jgi:Fe-S oxidoreductase
MLTLPEKILFALAVLATLYAAYHAVARLVRIIGRGRGRPDWKLAQKRLLDVILVKFVGLQPTWKLRLGSSLFHAFVAWGFTYYLLVNALDVVNAYTGLAIPGLIGGLYRLGADLLSAGVLVGMAYLIVRRWVVRPANLNTRESTLLHPRARFGIKRDSAIVGAFIVTHVGARFLGESFLLAAEPDPWQPLASAVSGLWAGWGGVEIAWHVTFWLALGTILAFIPYFPYSKHIHLFFAPLNFLLKPGRRSIGELSKIDFDDDKLEQFGATRLEDLGWEQVMDAYACIMCYRCQEVCPAYNTGKVLSPAALEINKRYFLNVEGAKIARGEASTQPLVEFAIPTEAIWACTACGACIDICPVGNEPMRDILDIRRSLVLMENQFPKQWQAAFRGMERTMNPWGVPSQERMKWAEGLAVKTIDENPAPEILWWVGCAPATDARAQKTARAFAEILNAAGVSYAVLGEGEQCTGDSARRAGKEDLFFQLALANVEILNEVIKTEAATSTRIVTTCPHCLHTIKNEYPAFGGRYTVIHHTQLINELLAAGKLKLKGAGDQGIGDRVTFHDPCYLGRHNGILADPRAALRQAGAGLIEMPRQGLKSFCCGAGGAQMWKEEEHGSERVNAARLREAQATGAGALAVGCPFCLTMLTDAAKETNAALPVFDVVEIVARQLQK